VVNTGQTQPHKHEADRREVKILADTKGALLYAPDLYTTVQHTVQTTLVHSGLWETFEVMVFAV